MKNKYRWVILFVVAAFLVPGVLRAQVTDCSPLTYDDLPYSEDFESYGYGYGIVDIHPCWRKGMVPPQTSGLNRPTPTFNEFEGDTVGLSFSNSSYFYCWAALPRLDDSVDVSNLEITFLACRPTYVSGSSASYSQLVVGVATDFNLDSTFVPVDTIDISDEQLGSVHNVAVRFDNYTGDGKYVVFISPTTDDNYTANSIIMDNVTLRQAVPCLTPQRLVVTSTTVDGVNATWQDEDDVDEWLVYIGAPGFSIDGATPHIVHTNSAFIGNLLPDTEYELVVVASCSDGEGYPSYPVHFHTLCAPLGSLPFVEDFESVEGIPTYAYARVSNLPHCWLHYNTSSEYNHRGFPTVCSDATAAHSGGNAMFFNSSSNAIAIMPLVSAAAYPLSNLQVSFWMRNFSYTMAEIVVGVMSDPYDSTTFVPVDTVSNIYNYSQQIVGFANYTGPHGHVAFKALVNNQVSIDDIILEEIPNRCPHITAIHAQSTASAARLTWDYSTNFGFPTNFDVSYRNVVDSIPITITTNRPELLLTGLAPDSSYWVTVAANCGGLNGDADTLVFSTQALPCISWDTIDLPVDTLVLGNPGTEINAITPINAGAPFSIVQHLFLSTEIPVSGPTMLNGIGFDYAFNQPYQVGNCEIYLAHTTRTDMSNGASDQGQLVYSGTLYFTAEGWNYVQFNQGTFLYDGTSNLCVTISKNSGVAVPTNRTFRHEATPDNNMTSWRARPNHYAAYSEGTAELDKRSNTRLITGGREAYCSGVATCLPPIVDVDTSTNGVIRLLWIPGYQEESWNVDYRLANPADTGSWINVATETINTEHPFSIANLQQGSQYEFRVTANCGDTALSASVTIATPCIPLSIPFHYGFEGLPTGGSTMPADIHCWHHLNDAGIYNGHPIITSGAHTGNRGLGFGVSTGSYYSNYQAIVLPPVDTDIDAINSLYLNFWARSSTITIDPILYVGVMTDPNDINTFYTVDSVFIDPATNGWDRYEVSFDNYNGDGQYIAIRADRPTEWYWSATIDDITVSYEPMCRRVDNILFRDVTTDSATVSWSRGGEEMLWELTVGDSVHYLTDTFYTIHGLESDTEYTVSIRAICGFGDTSNVWSALFHTPCYLLSTLPLINDFENEPHYQLHSTSYVEAFPACWRRVNDIPNNNNTNGRPYIRNTSDLHGNKSMYWELTYEYNNFFVVLPPVDKSVYNISDLYLMFYARTLSNSEQMASFVIGVMDHDSDTAHFVPVDTITPSRDPTLYTVSLANYSGTGNYIAIRSRRPNYDRELLLDDVVLTDHLCFPVSHLRASSTDTSVTLVWSPGASDSVAANELSYTVVLDNDTVRGVTDTFYTFHSLSSTTLYSYAVATECPTLNSIFQAGHIQTTCPVLTYDDLPYYEDFESYEYGYQQTISPCWRRGQVIATVSGMPPATHLYIGEDTVGLTLSAQSNYYRWVALPKLDASIDITQLELNFLIKRPGSGYNPIPSTRLIVGVAEDVTWYSGDLPATSMEISVPSYTYTYSGLVPVDTIDLSDEPISSLHNVSVRFENYTGDGRYIVIYAPSPESGMAGNGCDLDNIRLRRALPCPTVQHVRVTGTTADSVFATWHGTANANSWLVYIGAPGFDIGSAAPRVVNDTVARIGGLNPNTDYEIVIVSSCGGSEGYPSYPERFHTLCSPINSLPFVEDFESVTGLPSYTTHSTENTLPVCWLRYNTGTAGEYSGAPLIHNDSTYAHSGSNAMRFHTANISGECSDQYAIMPLTDPTLYPARGLQVSFWLRTAHFYYNSFIVVGVMSDPTDTSTFVAVDTARIVSLSDYSHHTVRMAGYRGPHGHIAFKAPYQSPVNRPYLDDIVLEEMPCAPAEDLHVVNTGLDSLTIVWTDTSSADIFWYVEYDTVDFTPGNGTATPLLVTDTFYTLTGLDSSTLYHIYVYPDCYDSVVARHLAATTLLSTPVTLPYICNFDHSENDWILLDGSERNYWTTGNATGNPGGSLYITDDGSSNHYSDTASTVFATRTFHIDASGEYAYRFDWKCNGEENRDFIRAALLPAQTLLIPGELDGFDEESIVSSGGIFLDGGTFLSQHTLWQSQSGTFTIDSPGDYIWVFLWHNDESTFNQAPAAIDNIYLVPNSCPMPQNVTGIVSADSLSLTWDEGLENTWEVIFGDTSIFVTEPACTLTNLPLSPLYTVHIRTICGSGDTSLAFTTTFLNNRYLVTVTANDPSFGLVSGGGRYYYGDIATLTATPLPNHIFSQWSDGDTNNPRTLFVTSDTTLIAIFATQEGIDVAEVAKYVVYPNPTHGEVTISTSERIATAILTDLTGRREEIKMTSTGEGSYTIDLTAYPQTIYFLTLTTTDGKQHTVKLLKRSTILAE